jgi:uncharacterized protein YqhQ
MAKFYYGGQALIEGVMMRGRKTVAVAIRRPDNSIYVHEESLNPRLFQSKILRLPFLRGLLLLWEMLVLGIGLMTLSANVASGAVNPAASAVPIPSTDEAKESGNEELPPAIEGATLVITLLISLSIAIAIFFVGPLLLTNLLRDQIGEGWLNLTLEGIIRLALLVGYLYLIGRIPDIQRVFGYHGAEHKAINAMEQGNPLDIAHVRRASRVHTRCGTGFLLLVMVISIFVFALVGDQLLFIKIVSRVVLIPVIAGIAYELMRLGAAYYHFRIVKWLLAPGLALQALTTREPDDSMIECAIIALQRVLSHDRPCG